MSVQSLHYYGGTQMPGRTAAGVQIAYMTQALSEYVPNVTVVTKGELTTTDHQIFEYYGLRSSTTFNLVPFRNRLALLAYLRKIQRLPRPDLVVSRYIYPALFAALRGIPTTYEVHTPATGYKRLAEHLLLRSNQLEKLVTITQALEKRYLSDYPNLEGKTQVLHDAANDPGDAILPKSQGKLTVSYVGSWYPGRGIETVVRLAQLLPHFNFVAAGGDNSDLSERKLEPPSNLTCLGYISPAAVNDVLRASDVLIAPYQKNIAANGGSDISRWMSPMKFFEYMSHGKAIVTSSNEVFKEVLEDRKNCLMVESDDICEWMEKLEELNQNRPLAINLGQAARSQFLDKHTWAERARLLLY